MAIVKYSSLVNQVIGKVGGVVFQKMGQSLGVRSIRSYRPSGSTIAGSNRFVMNTLAAVWQSLTILQKQAWQTVSSGYTMYNRYGQVIVLTGYQLFFYINKVKLLYYTGVTTAAPSYSGAFVANGLDGAAKSTGNDLLCTFLNAIDANTAVMIYISKLMPVGIKLKHPKYYFIKAVSNQSNVVHVTTAQCVALWGHDSSPGTQFYVTAKAFNVTYQQWKQDTYTICIPT
jgi:hypothetical protein